MLSLENHAILTPVAIYMTPRELFNLSLTSKGLNVCTEDRTILANIAKGLLHALERTNAKLITKLKTSLKSLYPKGTQLNETAKIVGEKNFVLTGMATALAGLVNMVCIQLLIQNSPSQTLKKIIQFISNTRIRALSKKEYELQEAIKKSILLKLEIKRYYAFNTKDLDSQIQKQDLAYQESLLNWEKDRPCNIAEHLVKFWLHKGISLKTMVDVTFQQSQSLYRFKQKKLKLDPAQMTEEDRAYAERILQQEARLFALAHHEATTEEYGKNFKVHELKEFHALLSNPIIQLTNQIRPKVLEKISGCIPEIISEKMEEKINQLAVEILKDLKLS